MTIEDRQQHEENLNALKSVFEDIGLESTGISGNSEDCNGWASMKSGDLDVTAYYGSNYVVRFAYNFNSITIEELRDKLKLLVDNNINIVKLKQ